jgi:hypothetical protein
MSAWRQSSCCGPLASVHARNAVRPRPLAPAVLRGQITEGSSPSLRGAGRSRLARVRGGSGRLGAVAWRARVAWGGFGDGRRVRHPYADKLATRPRVSANAPRPAATAPPTANSFPSVPGRAGPRARADEAAQHRGRERTRPQSMASAGDARGPRRPRRRPAGQRRSPSGGAGHAPQTEPAEPEVVSGDRTRPPQANGPTGVVPTGPRNLATQR